MSFPEVPIDETLFEGNALMRQYWERSTENRSMNFVPDVRHEELALPDDLAEAARHLELGDGQDHPRIGRPPEDRLPFREPREDAGAIREEEPLGV
jgi:hypothetical protein